MSTIRVNDGYGDTLDLSEDAYWLAKRLDRIGDALERLADSWEKQNRLSEVALAEHGDYGAHLAPTKEQIS